jgi:hypothetical protein
MQQGMLQVELACILHQVFGLLINPAASAPLVRSDADGWEPNMTEESEQDREKPGNSGEVTWGPRLFFGTLLAVLVFFYWLLIYSGGVSGHGG